MKGSEADLDEGTRVSRITQLQETLLSQQVQFPPDLQSARVQLSAAKLVSIFQFACQRSQNVLVAVKYRMGRRQDVAMTDVLCCH